MLTDRNCLKVTCTRRYKVLPAKRNNLFISYGHMTMAYMLSDWIFFFLSHDNPIGHLPKNASNVIEL